jgi:single-stranded-DNA-specific exonuclease
MSEGTWRISPVDLSAAQLLSEQLGLSRVTAEVLARRGFTDVESARAFLQPDCLFHDPYLMAGMAAARVRIDRALSRGERIMVYGDYDADGVCAAFLLTDVLRQLGADVSWRLPNRFREGYGLSPQAADDAAAADASLLLTVDCGSKDVEAVQHALDIGVDVVVTDHHELGEQLPPCTVVSPRLGSYPFPHLAGVGVALKLAHALLVPSGGPARTELPLRLRPYVDVAALGTVADVVPMLDENRALVGMGIGRLRSAPRPGLAALLEASGTALDAVTAETLGYRLAPRINAAGRLDDPARAMRLLEAPDRQTALPLALALNELNAARQQLEREILTQAAAMIADPPPPALVLHDPAWHEGVLGIVASRLAEAHNRPTILLCGDGELAKGSGRSIPGFDLVNAVAACSGSLERFGGHPAACGLRLRPERIADFTRQLVDYAATNTPADTLAGRAHVDAVVAGTELTLSLASELERLGPHGEGNARVALLLHAAEVLTPQRTRDGRHLRCRVRCNGACASAIHFNYEAQGLPGAEERYDILLELARDSYNGDDRAQVKVGSLFPLTLAGDLCATPCDGTCEQRLSGRAFWEALTAESGWAIQASPAAASAAAGRATAGAADNDDAEEQAAALVAQLHAGGRLLQTLGRPIVPTVVSLLAEPGRALLLVADVGRRRPLLTRTLPLDALGRRGMYLAAACAHDRLAPALGEQTAGGVARSRPVDTVVASAVTAASHPQFVASFDQVIFLDPPLDAVSLVAVLAAAAGSVRFVWGDPEVHFAGTVADADYDIDATLRRLWRGLPAQGSPAARAVEEGLFVAGPLLAKLPALSAAWRVLREAGLLAADGGKNEVEPGSGKVDLTVSPTYRLWHRRFRNRYPQRCPTASR